jgi:hypothetical protein
LQDGVPYEVMVKLPGEEFKEVVKVAAFIACRDEDGRCRWHRGASSNYCTA